MRVHLAALVAIAVWTSAPPVEAVGAQRPASAQNLPNIVVFITDDQREDTLWAMPHVQELLVGNGVRFSRAYSTTAECCPFRASFHSGGFCPANTGVKDGNPLNGGMSHFRQDDTLALRMQRAGYATGFVGHYMHGYYSGYVPAGWTSFVGNHPSQYTDWMNLKKITYGSTTDSPGAGQVVASKVQYLIEFQRDEALLFLGTYVSAPFFLVVASHAPHYPATPAPQDEELFLDFKPSGPWFLEDISDKPQWVHTLASMYVNGAKTGLARKQLRSLQSTDRLVRDIVDVIDAAGKTGNTYYFFVSDNGLLWGEHRLAADKGAPYEESIKVPLVVSGPGVVSRTDDHLVSADLDVPATILDLAGMPVHGDGRSLLSFLQGQSTPWREFLLLENYGYLESERLGVGPLWSAVRAEDATGSWKYVEYSTGEGELYDLAEDEHELENRFDDPAYIDVQRGLRRALKRSRGLAMLTREVPLMTVGVGVSHKLRTWGGQAPFSWEVVDGSLPPGIRLGRRQGRLRGTPKAAGPYEFTVRVVDSGMGRHSLKPEEFSRQFVVEVEP